MRRRELCVADGRTMGERPLRELSIAQSLVDTATRHAAGRRVTRIEVGVGRLREIDSDSLHLAFGLLTHGTALDGAELGIRVLAGEDVLIEAVESEPRVSPQALA
jgi:Zn finger protein HypA/HybF involved in hydrogenase expression